MACEKYGNWKQATAVLSGGGERIHKAVQHATARNAVLLVREIVKGIQKSAPGGVALAPNAPATIALKGSSKPLVDKSFLLQAITQRLMGDRAFVGVLRSSQRADGGNNANIAAIMEFGATVPTPNGGAIIIPPRPFLAPVLKAMLPTLVQNYRNAIASAMHVS